MSAAASATLESSTRDILVAWERATEQWRDGKSQQFGTTYIEPLPDLATQARDAMMHLESLIRKIKNDCE
jgi:hypothetical protein